MLLIGPIAILLWLWPIEARAEPVSIVILTALAIEATATAVAITTFALTFIASTALSLVASAILKPASQKGAAGASAASTTDNKVSVRQAAAPRPIIYGRVRVAGVYVAMVSSFKNRLLHTVLAIAGHPISSYDEYWVNDQAVTFNGDGTVTSGPFTDYVRFAGYLGTTDQEADPNLVRDAEGQWLETDRLRGVAYLYVKFDWDAKTFVGGLPNITAVVKGKKVYDPRLAATVYSANPALCLADYLCDPTFGIPIAYSDIDETALIAAANACDEVMTNPDGTTEARFECHGVLSSADSVRDNIGKLLSAMYGRLVYNGSKWRIIAGVYQTPTITLTDDDLRAGPKVQTRISRRDRFNAVKGTFTGPANNWQVANFPEVASEAFKTIDGSRIYKDVQFEMTTSLWAAQRLAAIDLLKSRQEITVTMPCKLSAWRVQAGDTIQWNSDRYGWVGKVFEVASVRFAADTSGGGPVLGIDLVLRETVSSVYDGTGTLESVDDASPNTTLPDSRTVLPASNLRVSESLYTARDGAGLRSKVVLAWDASPDAFVTSGGRYRLQVRAVGETAWATIVETDELTAEWLDPVPALYDVAVVAVNYRQVESQPVIVRRELLGLSAAPAAPTGLTIGAMGNTVAWATWDRSADLDVLEGGQAVFRFSPLTSGATWADGVTVSDPRPGGASEAFLPLKTGTYMLKFRDSSGQWSEMASFYQAQKSALEFATLTGGTLTEDPGFTGSKTAVLVDTGVLKLDSTDVFDDVADVDALASWDYAGPVATEGTYDWSDVIDLGSVKRCRLTIGMTSIVVNELDTVDGRLPDVDDWASWDGEVSGDEADALTEVRTTPDDPAGAPTWSAWQRVDTAEFEARAFQLRTILKANDNPSFNIHVSALSALVEGVV